MGQAKLRGTREQRIAQAVERKRQARATCNLQRFQALSPDQQQRIMRSMAITSGLSPEIGVAVANVPRIPGAKPDDEQGA